MTGHRLRYAAPLRPLLAVLGMGPSFSGVEVDGEQLRVRMVWLGLEDPDAFLAGLPRAPAPDPMLHELPS